MALRYPLCASLACLAAIAIPLPLFAGGGGQNMLLLVNPNDEASLRIANAYAALRDIPNSNILFLPPESRAGYPDFTTTASTFTTSYANPISAALTARGIDTQIDYIATIGQPKDLGGTYKSASGASISVKLSFNYALSMMTQLQRGMPLGSSDFGSTDPGAAYRLSELLQSPPPSSGAWSYVAGSNTAIHHSTNYAIAPGNTAPPGFTTAQWYMSGNVGNAGQFALTTQQVINNLAYTVAGDGTKPAGKIYFEDNGDALRTGTRKTYWPAVQAYMTAHNIPWVQETNVSGATPLNRTDVRGAVIGAASPKYPNGSVYLPGSYVDDLTSDAGGYGSNSQVKADKTLLTGAAGTAGTITEPYAIQDRFTYSSVFVFSNDGSTLGEAHFKSIARPDVDMFEGDLLSQAYADVPRVTLTSAPTNFAHVSGSINIGAAGILVGPLTTTATAVNKLQLFVDGIDKGSVNAASGALPLNTTTLSDGVHEIRVVGYNNSAAASQGYIASNIIVDNKGESVAASTAPVNAYWNQSLTIPASAVAGTGTVTSIQLQSLGRVVGTLSGSSGNVTLNSTSLAYGDNQIVPVAIYADGSQVQGQSFTVTRDFHRLAGAPIVAPLATRTPGVRYEYFAGTAGRTIAATDFTAAPTSSQQGTILNIAPNSAIPANVNMPDAYRYTAGNNNVGLAVRASTEMLVTTPGEYSFWFTSQGAKWDSLQFSVDGFSIISHEFWNGTKFDNQGMASFAVDTTASIYLAAGQHDLQLLLASFEGSGADGSALNNWWYKGPDGVSAQPSTAVQSTGTSFYTATNAYSTWATNTNGNLGVAGNWVGTHAPTAGVIARFVGNTAATINVAAAQTIGGIAISGTTDYTIASSNASPITFDNTGAPGNSALSSAGGNQTISAPIITTASNLDISAAAGTLNLSGNISGSGNLTIAGPGVILLNGNTTTTGTTTINSGTLGGHGTLTGALLAGSAAHTIAPSATLAPATTTTLTLGALTTNAHTTLAFNLNGPANSDRITITSTNALTLGPGTTLAIANTTTGPSSLGYYKIIQYAGSPPATSNLLLPTVQNNIAYSLDTTKDPNFIDLHRGFLGDANDDGSVTFADFVQLSNNFGQPNTHWSGGDFNGDGATTFADFVLLSNNFGQSISGSDVVSAADRADFQSLAASFTAANVPEPASLALLALGSATLLLKRKRMH